MSCECKCKFDGLKCNSDQQWNNNKCRCKFKERHVCEKDCIWNPATCSCRNGKYLASIMDDSELVEKTRTIPKNFNEKKAIGKMQNLYVLVSFLLITMALLIAVSIYCYLINYQAKQKHLLPFHVTNDENLILIM